MIQARHISFNIHYGRYIKPLEINLSKRGKFRHHFGKGTPNQIACRIQKLASRWKYYTEGDHSTFDAHVTVEMLQLTHAFYNSCFQSKELSALCRRTINNKCVSRHGDRYTVRGTRMSGDMDTSLGNSLINLAILQELLFHLDIEGEAIVNGDDFILFTESPVPIHDSQIVLRWMNMETKMKPSTTNIHEVEFCRKKMVYNTSGQPIMLPDIDRVFNTFGLTVAQIDCYKNFLLEVLHGTWKSYKSNPVGLCFKELFHWFNNYERQQTGKNFIGAYKYLDRTTQYTIKLAKKDPEETSSEVMLSALTAYEEILHLNTLKKRLFHKILPFFTNPRLRRYGSYELQKQDHISDYVIIDHVTQTIDVS